MKKLHRFIGNFELKEGNFVIEDEQIVHQIREVLHLKIGESLILCNGQNNQAEGLILNFGKNSCEVNLKTIEAMSPDAPRKITLFCAILKNENFELIIQKATELGVTAIQPIITKHTVKLNVRLERLQKIAQEAAELSWRGVALCQ